MTLMITKVVDKNLNLKYELVDETSLNYGQYDTRHDAEVAMKQLQLFANK